MIINHVCDIVDSAIKDGNLNLLVPIIKSVQEEYKNVRLEGHTYKDYVRKIHAQYQLAVKTHGDLQSQ